MPKHNGNGGPLGGMMSGVGGDLPSPDDMLSGPAMRDVTLGGDIEDPTSILSSPNVDNITSPEAHTPEVNEVGPLNLPVVGPSWLVGDN